MLTSLTTQRKKNLNLKLNFFIFKKTILLVVVDECCELRSTIDNTLSHHLFG
jgi:hypothetical protein